MYNNGSVELSKHRLEQSKEDSEEQIKTAKEMIEIAENYISNKISII